MLAKIDFPVRFRGLPSLWKGKFNDQSPILENSRINNVHARIKTMIITFANRLNNADVRIRPSVQITKDPSLFAFPVGIGAGNISLAFDQFTQCVYVMRDGWRKQTIPCDDLILR